MEDTGRISRTLCATASRIVFGETVDASSDGELWAMTEIDRAHIVMLVEQKLLDRRAAARLLASISQLRGDGFAPLHGERATRGLYLHYENFLIGKLGADIGGALHMGRSRNDLGATLFLMRLRRPTLQLLREALRLQAVLLARARRALDMPMPAYTHYQAAQPITFGHWLAGVASAIERDIAAILDGVLPSLDECPLGAGAVAGTSFPISAQRTAELLGFTRPTRHSIDAIANRDAALRLLSAEVVLGVTLGRAATDLLTWSTAEFGFLAFPDFLVGSSSMMPQKRNPFLLEHVQGLAAKPLGALVAASTASHAKPFGNSVAVNTQGVSVVWEATRAITDAIVLARLTVAFARPDAAAMRRATMEGFTAATELANQLVRGGLPFREAHRQVGAAIREALSDAPASGLHDAVIATFVGGGAPLDPDGLTPEAIVAGARFGGGPAPSAVSACIDDLHSSWRGHLHRLRAVERRWREAGSLLEAAARRLVHEAGDEVET